VKQEVFKVAEYGINRIMGREPDAFHASPEVIAAQRVGADEPQEENDHQADSYLPSPSLASNVPPASSSSLPHQ